MWSSESKIRIFCLMVEYQRERHEWEFMFPFFSRYSYVNYFPGCVWNAVFYSHSQSKKLELNFSFPFPIPNVGNWILHSQSKKLGISLPISHSQSQMCKSSSRSCLLGVPAHTLSSVRKALHQRLTGLRLTRSFLLLTHAISLIIRPYANSSEFSKLCLS